MSKCIVTGGAEYKEEVKCPRCEIWFSCTSDPGVQIFKEGLCPDCLASEKIIPHNNCHWHNRWSRLLELAWDAAVSNDEALYTLRLMRVVQKEFPDPHGQTTAYFLKKLQDM